jgi:hypothetical protein
MLRHRLQCLPVGRSTRRTGMLGAAMLACMLVGVPGAEAATRFLGSGGQLNPCESIYAPNNQFRLLMACDGNLVLLNEANEQLWGSGTGGYEGSVLQMQKDGNLVVYSPGHIAQWSAHTGGHRNAVLGVQDDGNVVIIAPGNHPVWATNTAGGWPSVSTPQLKPARYPASFQPMAAAAWARANYNKHVRGEPSDPCTYFVSRALREGGGMPTSPEWFPSSKNRAWNLVQAFKDNFTKSYRYARLIQIDPGNPASSGVALSDAGSMANTGDLIYYQWNGVDSIANVHFSMITGWNGKVALVTEQTTGHVAIDRPWNVSYINRGNTLLQLHPHIKAYILHWE